MNPRRYAAPILEAWATWETFRRLGFRADDLFWEFANTLNAIPKPGITLALTLKAQGKVYRVTCSHRLSEGEARRMERESRKFMESYQKGEFPEEEMKKILAESWVTKNQVGLVVSLKSQGFDFPFRMN